MSYGKKICPKVIDILNFPKLSVKSSIAPYSAPENLDKKQIKF